MIVATSFATIAIIVAVLVVLAWIVYVAVNLGRSRKEAGSEIELAPNRKPYYSDEELEGPRLDRALALGVGLLLVVAVGLPIYWLAEPGRQAGAVAEFDAKRVEWGAQLFATTAEGGFNCAGCHGAGGVGGVANYTFNDPVTGQVKTVAWKAPALTSVLAKYTEAQLTYILVYGRPFSPMSAWGIAGGGPMNDQQIANLIAYIASIQKSPDEIQQEVQTALAEAMASGKYATMGEALFNLEAGQGAYNCARCHTRGWSYGEPAVAGGGAMGPNLTGGSTIRQFPDLEQQIAFIEQGSVNGKPYGVNGLGSGRMPGFSAVFTPEQIRAVVEYERSL